MRRPDTHSRSRGFSLTELLVAVLFISILMAGTATVFKGSLGSFVTATEKLSSLRQNQLATDLLLTDLTYAGLSLSPSIIDPPSTITDTNPAFQVLPNVSYPNTDEATHVGDQLFLYYDRILPYASTIGTAVPGTSQLVAGNNALGYGNGFTLAFNDSDQAALASREVTSAMTAGMKAKIFFQSIAYPLDLESLSATGTVTLASTFTSKSAAPVGSTANLIITGEYIRYSIQPLLLDPANPTTYTPCLVRDLIAYPGNSAASWTSPVSTSIIAENVSAFHVGLSADGGLTWAGLNAAQTAWDTSATTWADITGAASGAATPKLNYQLAHFNSGVTPAPTVTGAGGFWFRQYPVLVRLDITTRTALARADYARGTNLPAYRYQTRSLIINPRHFGLAY